MTRRPSNVRTRAILVLSLVLVLLTATLSLLPHVSSVTEGFSFASAGDFATLTTGAGQQSLDRLTTAGVDFFLGVGDFSYSSATTGDIWCSQFKAKYNNIEIGAGNHDTGETTDQTGTRSYERYTAGCSYTLASTITCGPVAGQCYGKEYYFDYPSINPVARFIMVSPRVFNLTGVCTTTCNAGALTPCTDTYGCWPYNANDPHWTWTANAIDNARGSGIKWVIVGMHKVCISAGSESCNIGLNLFNMLVSKKVDLILQGHDHTYQRSKQIGFNGSTCTGIATVNSYPQYNSDCVVDDGSKGFYNAGAGTVIIIEGTFGAGYSKVADNATRPNNVAEAPYFVSLMGTNTPGNGHGFLKYTVSSTGIDIQTMFAGTYQDSFSIGSTSSSLTIGFTYSPTSPAPGSQVTFTATASGGTPPYAFSWAFGDGSTGTGDIVTHSYSTAGTYTVTLTASDSASPTPNTQTVAQTITVIAPLSATFTYTPGNPVILSPVTFTGSATGGIQPYSFDWNFGDGSTGSGASVSHIYLLPGTFTVTLTVTDAKGTQATASQAVTVGIGLGL